MDECMRHKEPQKKVTTSLPASSFHTVVVDIVLSQVVSTDEPPLVSTTEAGPSCTREYLNQQYLARDCLGLSSEPFLKSSAEL